MNIFNYQFKFKKIKSNDRLFLNDGLFSNSHWLFKADWLESLNCKMTLQLRKRLQKAKLELVTAKLSGEAESMRIPELRRIIDAVNLNEYYEINIFERGAVKKIEGFAKNEYSKGIVAFGIKLQSHLISIDAEYFAALVFDPQIKVMVKDASSPVALLKNNELVGLVMPLRPNEGRN